jgi:archaellum component FlaC
LLVLFVMQLKNARAREQRAQQLEIQLEEARKSNRELGEQLDARGRQADEIQGKMSKLREEVKKIKKKAFIQEVQDKGPSPTEEAEMDKLQQQTVERLKGETNAFRARAEQALEEAQGLREQVEKLQQELSAAKAAPVPKNPEPKEKPTEIATGPDSAAQLRELERKVKDLDSKLEAARRKARTDSQVYKVTKSKLSLAMERIGYLEKTFGVPSTQRIANRSSQIRTAGVEPSAPSAEIPPPRDPAPAADEPSEEESVELEKTSLPV